MPKGFTLIELLIVIAILAILATVTVLVINPAEILAQARDSQRVSDLKTITDSVNLYIVTVDTKDLNLSTTNTQCRPSSDVASCHPRYSLCTTTSTSTTPRSIDGTGWVDVDFRDVPGGSPMSILPADPIRDSDTYFYSYCSDTGNLEYEVTAKLESDRYVNGGTNDLESTDGGNSDSLFERGNKLNI